MNNIISEQKQQKLNEINETNIKDNKKKRKNVIINNNLNKMRFINLNENEINDFINLGSKKPIYKINPNTKIRTKYI